MFDDDVNLDIEPRKQQPHFTLAPPTPPAKEVLKSISLNTNISSLFSTFNSSASLVSKLSKSPDFNNNNNKMKSVKRILSSHNSAAAIAPHHNQHHSQNHSIDYYFNSSCSSPVSQKDSSSSVVIPAFKCKTSSTSIYVEPNEPNLEPLTEKDYPQYRLFPAPTDVQQSSLVDEEMEPSEDAKKTVGATAVPAEIPLYSPPLQLSSCSSSSPASSCCSSRTTTSNSSMNSPDYSNTTATTSIQRRSPFINKFFIK